MPNGIAPDELLPEESKDWSSLELKDWRKTEALRWGPGTHPIEQARLYFPFPLYDWQADCLKASARQHSRVIVSCCNEAGKTSVVIPVFGLSCMAAFPGCTVYATSASERQIKYQLFEDQLKSIIQQKHMMDAGWEIKTGTDLVVTAPNGSMWLGYVCKDEKNVEGFHGKWKEIDGVVRYCPLIYINDESKGIGDNIRAAEKRIDPDFELSLSSPGEENGWFYEGIGPDTLRDEVKV